MGRIRGRMDSLALSCDAVSQMLSCAPKYPEIARNNKRYSKHFDDIGDDDEHDDDDGDDDEHDDEDEDEDEDNDDDDD